MEISRYTRVKRIFFLGVPIDILSPQNLEEVVREMLSEESRNHIILLDLWGLMKAKRNDLFYRTLHDAALVLPISKTILSGIRFLKKEPPERIFPFDFLISLLGILERLNKSVYILGSRARALNVIAGNIRTSFPSLKVVGRHTGYYKKEREQDIKLAIKKASPSLLLTGFGIKGKDRWIFENKKHFSPGIFLWDGLCLDIFSGKKQKPSKKSWENGTYVFRILLQQPWRIFRGFVYFFYYLLLLIYKLKKE